MSTQTEESVFSAEGVTHTPEAEVVENPDTSENAFANQLAEIKNERGEPKYKDLPTALEALKASQEYIPQLKSRTQELEGQVNALQEQLSKQASLEEFMERLQKPSEQAPTQEQQPESQGGVTLEQLQSLIEQTLQNKERQTMAERNSQTVETALREAYGDSVRDVIAAKAQEYGMTPERIQEISKESPQLALSMFDLKPQSQRKPSISSANIPPIKPNQHPELKRPEKSLLLGASGREQREFMARVKEEVYRKHGITN